MGSVEQRQLLADVYALIGTAIANAECVGGARACMHIARAREIEDRIAAALREQPEARGVVDDVTRDAARWRKLIANTKTDHIWHFVLSEEHKEGHDHFLDAIDALPLIAAQQPVQEGGGECPKCRDTGEVCTGYIDGTPEMFDCTCPAAAPPSAPVGVEGGAWTDADMQKPWGAEAASLRHLADDPALNTDQAAMLRHCAKRIESTAGIQLRALADMLDPAKQAGVLRDAADALPEVAQQPAAVDEAYRRGFVDGAKWWEWEKTGATMWQSDQQRAYDKATEKLATQHQEPTTPGDDAAGGECDRCGGSGTIPAPTGSGPDQHDVDVDCPTCGGTGAFQ